MKPVKSVMPILAVILILSTLGAVYAPNGDGIPSNGTSSSSGGDDVIVPIDPTTLFSGYLTVSVNPQVAHVGDTVTITIIATNNGLVDWCPLKIYAPVPEGLQFLSFTAPGLNLQSYDPDNGIWDVYRMRCIERGQQKTGIITAKVLPGAAGKQIKVTARFSTIVLEGYDIHMENTGHVAAARADTLSVSNINDTSIENNTAPDDGQGVGLGIGPGNGTGIGMGDGNGAALINSLGNTQLADTLNNLSTSEKKDPLKNLQTGGGGGNGKANEVFIGSPQTQDTSLAMYILAALLIIGLIVIGCFYGMKR